MQSQNILDLLDVSPSPVIPTAAPSGSEPPKSGAADLLDLLDMGSGPSVPPMQAPATGNLMDGLIGSSSVSTNMMNGSASKLTFELGQDCSVQDWSCFGYSVHRPH